MAAVAPPPSRFWPPGRTRFRRAPCGWRGRGSAAAGGRPRGRAAPPRGTAWSGNRPPQCQGRSEPTVHRCGQSKIKSVPALWRGCGGRWQSHPRRASSHPAGCSAPRRSAPASPALRMPTPLRHARPAPMRRAQARAYPHRRLPPEYVPQSRHHFNQSLHP